MKLRIGVIGIGTMGLSFVRYALPICEEVFVYDSNPQQLNHLTARLASDQNPYDLSAEFFELSELESKIKYAYQLNELFSQKLDLVVIATHKETHCDLTQRALEAGAQVLVEKTIACTLNEAKTMLQSAQKNQKYLFVDFCLHHYPEFVFLKDYVSQFQNTVRQYEIIRIAEIKDPKAMGYHAGVDLQVHDIDFCLQVFGEPDEIIRESFEIRESKMSWHYKNGMRVNLIALFPEIHPVGFEYQYKCTFLDQQSLSYESISDVLMINHKIYTHRKYSPVRAVLQDILSVVAQGYQPELKHPLRAEHAVQALELLERSKLKGAIAL